MLRVLPDWPGIDDKRRVLATGKDKIRRGKAPDLALGQPFNMPCMLHGLESSPGMPRDTSVATQKNEHSHADAQLISPSTDSKPPPSAYFLCRRRRAKGREREAAPSNPNMARGLLAAALVACAAVAQEVQMEARASVRCPTLSITKLEMRAPPAARGPRQPAQGLCPAASGCPTHRRPARRPHTQ